MASQRAEHAGAIAAILLIHVLHQVTGAKFSTTLWIDNAEVIRRATEDNKNRLWKKTLVLDYDLWMVTRKIQQIIEYPMKWEKVDSHVKEKLKKTQQEK